MTTATRTRLDTRLHFRSAPDKPKTNLRHNWPHRHRPPRPRSHTRAPAASPRAGVATTLALPAAARSPYAWPWSNATSWDGPRPLLPLPPPAPRPSQAPCVAAPYPDATGLGEAAPTRPSVPAPPRLSTRTQRRQPHQAGTREDALKARRGSHAATRRRKWRHRQQKRPNHLQDSKSRCQHARAVRQKANRARALVCRYCPPDDGVKPPHSRSESPPGG